MTLQFYILSLRQTYCKTVKSEKRKILISEKVSLLINTCKKYGKGNPTLAKSTSYTFKAITYPLHVRTTCTGKCQMMESKSKWILWIQQQIKHEWRQRDWGKKWWKEALSQQWLSSNKQLAHSESALQHEHRTSEWRKIADCL